MGETIIVHTEKKALPRYIAATLTQYKLYHANELCCDFAAACCNIMARLEATLRQHCGNIKFIMLNISNKHISTNNTVSEYAISVPAAWLGLLLCLSR